MSCLFEPIHGRFPTHSICDSYPDCVGCSYSDPFKQPKQTNADRIRAMTDEELAEWFGMSERMCPDGFSETIDCDACPEVCTGHWLLWLQQEAET